MYRLELITKDEYLIDGKNFTDFTDLMITYNSISKQLSNRSLLKDKILQVFVGQDFENLKEIKKYRIEF